MATMYHSLRSICRRCERFEKKWKGLAGPKFPHLTANAIYGHERQLDSHSRSKSDFAFKVHFVTHSVRCPLLKEYIRHALKEEEDFRVNISIVPELIPSTFHRFHVGPIHSSAMPIHTSQAKAMHTS